MAAAARYYQRAKNAVHALQALLMFIGAIITIAIYTKGGKSDSRINYFFVLCFLSIPILIYQTACPIYPRTKRFSNAYAHAGIDALWTILWFAAWVGMVVFVHQGSHSAKDWKSSDHLCETFNSAWGPTSKCKLGQGAIGMGVIICLLFVLTTAFSIYGISHYRTHGSLPAYDTRPAMYLQSDEAADNHAFSANTPDKFTAQEEMQEMHPNVHDDDDHDHDNDHYTLHSNPEDDHHPNPNPNRPFSWARQPTPELSMDQDFEPVDTSYHGSGETYNTQYPLPYPPPSPLSNRVPSPRYETMHSNQSNFVGGLQPIPQPPPSPLSNRVPSPNYDAINSNLKSNPYNSGSQPLPQPPPSPLSNRVPSPRYDTLNFQSNESHFSGGLQLRPPPPLPLQPGGAGDPFRDGLTLSHEPGGYSGGSGKLDFPEGEYGR